MLDLKKLEENLKAVIEQETEESFNQWLEDKRKREVLSLLMGGRNRTVILLNNDTRKRKKH